LTWWTTYTQQQWDNGILVYKSHIADRKYIIFPTDKWKKRSNNSHPTTDRKYMISPTDKWKKQSNNSHPTTDRKYMISPTDKWKKRSNNSHRTTDRKYMISPTDKWKKRSNNSHRTTDRKYIIFATKEMEDQIRQHLHSHRNKISDKRQLTIAGQLQQVEQKIRQLRQKGIEELWG
jgi:hypothetical protein